MSCTMYFEIIRDVIYEQIASLMTRHGMTYEDICRQVTQNLEENSRQWYSGIQPDICYTDPLCRLAYLYSCVPANANLVQRALASERSVLECVENAQKGQQCVRVCAFGGGPGTELLGLSKWLEVDVPRSGFVVDFELLDRVPQWRESWQAICALLAQRFTDRWGTDRALWPWSMGSRTFAPVELTNGDTFADMTSVFGHDLYILSYVVSEVVEQARELGAVTKVMVESAPRTARFLIIDRNEVRQKAQVRQLAESAGLVLGSFTTDQSPMDIDEQCSCYGALLSNFRRMPRVTWNAFWVVGRKR